MFTRFFNSKKLVFNNKKLFFNNFLFDYGNKKEDLKEVSLCYGFGINYLFFNFKNFKFFNNFVFSSNFIFKEDNLINFVINYLKLFLKGLNQGFFSEFRIIGLGFRIKKSNFKKSHSLRFDIGYSHIIRLRIPYNIRFFRVKRKFLIFSNDFFTMNIFKKEIARLSQLNPYKIRGLKLTKQIIKMKQGKKQNKR